MFEKIISKTPETPQAPRPAAPTRTPQAPSAAAPVRAPQQATAPVSPTGGQRNILSNDVHIKGSIRFTDDLLVDGRIEGEISSDGSLTVAENVALGLPSSRGIRTDLEVVSNRILEISERYGLAVDPGIEIWKLSVGERQRVEIIKALYRDAELLVLDEPTAVLTPQEVDDLFVILRKMTAEGTGIVFISHKLQSGETLGNALEATLTDLDGFFTFVVGTKDGFGVVRDPIACKPAVMAETDQYVAFGSEYRALVNLPGIEDARVWEPEPATVYFWNH